jgi:HSP20 family molecular chaperone IbpA
VTLAPGALLVEVDRHPGELAADQSRDFVLQELPDGTVRRHFELPVADLALDSAEAHFANGMLTVTITTVGREAYRRDIRGT